MATLIGSRYAVLKEPPREGGLADVLACTDLEQGGQRVAVKLLKNLPDKDETLQLLFEREVSALQELRHENIVHLQEAGIDEESGRYFLALEWVPHDLPGWLAAHPPASTEEFLEQVGLPILRALSFAHERKVVHRDVKPSNVLVTDDGTPKLADFGISKIKTSLSEGGHTLAAYSSRPYAPPEAESKSSFSRDVFAFGVFLLACLTKGPIEGYEDFAPALDALEADLELIDLVESCVSLDPSDRPRSAPELLLRLEAVQRRHRAEEQRIRTISLDLSGGAKRRIMEEEQIPEAGVRDLVLRELADAPSLRPLLDTGETATVFDGPWFGEARHLFLFGDEWSFRAVAEGEGPRLTVIGAARIGAIETDLERERHLVLDNVRFTLDPPLNYATARDEIRQLVEESFAHEGIRHGERRAKERARLFEQWGRQLDAREGADEEREDRVSVVVKGQDGYRLTLAPTEEPPDLEGQQRVLLDGRGRYIARGAVDLGSEGELTLYLERLPTRPIPSAGFLALDTGASRSKLFRERDALARVRFGSSGLVSVALPELLLEPSQADAVEPTPIGQWLQDDLDEHKRSAVEHALASSQFTVVHGPPGTGKTTFIAELVGQELARDPNTRILLTSQTHVAVDNALQQIRKVSPAAKLLRVGRRAQEKIAPDVLDLSVETQLERWRAEVRSLSTASLESLLAEHGVDVSTVARSLRLAELSDVVRRVRLCEIGIDRRIEQLRAGAEEEGALGEDAREDIEAEIEKLRDGRDLSERRARQLLDDSQLDGMLQGVTVDELDPTDIADRANSLLPTSGTGSLNLRQLVDTQAKWLERIASGTEFEAALVVSSQLVAGTCVGIAGAPGIDDGEFALCIVDEASKATPTETLVPMVRAKRWVLVGDENQLPPFLDEALRDAAVQQEFGLDPAELKQTLFGRMANGLPSSSSRSLDRQYRMVPAIGDLISHCFYGERLQSAPKQELSFTPDLQGTPACWLATDSLEDRRERSAGETSYLNLCEARELMRYLRALNEHVARASIDGFDVLVLAPYGEQVRELDRRVRQDRERLPSLHVEVNTVDAAQGREADALVFSAVRSNTQGRMGFVRELERANVALSRGKYLLTIIGDMSFFDRAGGPFSDVLRYMRQHPSTCTLKELRGAQR